MAENFLKLNDVRPYKRAYHLAGYVWDIVSKWNILAQKTIGEQFIRSTDSIAANIAEGFGRFGKRDKIKFYRYAYGSTYESLNWNQQAKDRGLVSKEQYDHILQELQALPKEINGYIKLTNAKLQK
ncbi:MAG: four helix bundle protein [Candidatus Peribacteraceae bacterium]|nr:four helix bundle protein [Candidatus Peribacteraceae bacterium]